MPKVTVLLTSYNHEEFIADSIESILNQTYTDFELYIVDDCSMDNSWEVIQKYNDPRIIAIHHEKNMFGCSNREFYKNFKGQYFAMAHCDDLWELDKLEKQVKYLDEHPEAGACFSWVQLIDDYGNNYDNPDHPYSKVFLEENMNRFEWLNHFFYNGNRLCHPSSLIRLNIQMNENLFPGGLGALPDFYRWIKLCLKHEIYVYPERLTKFRIHVDESNMSGQTPTNRIRVQNEFYQIAKLYGLIQDQSEFLKVFPEANEYVVDGRINVDYALAQIMLNKTNNKGFHFYAMNKLMELVRNEKTKDELIELYGFTKRDVCNISGRLDLFHVIADDEYLTTSLFYANEEGFSEEHKLSKTITMMNNHFKVTFDLENKEVKQLRFDPTEGKYISLKNISILIDNQKYDLPEVIRYHEMDGDWIDIYSLDPSLLIDLKKTTLVNKVVIEADIKYIENSKLLNYENKVEELRRKSIDNLSIKQLLSVIKNRGKR
ncbi:glycosyltransferase [Eubacterium sp. TM05-53]|nr:glycosyltransferase [Eubacterium sp. TM05-53]